MPPSPAPIKTLGRRARTSTPHAGTAPRSRTFCMVAPSLTGHRQKNPVRSETARSVRNAAGAFVGTGLLCCSACCRALNRLPQLLHLCRQSFNRLFQHGNKVIDTARMPVTVVPRGHSHASLDCQLFVPKKLAVVSTPRAVHVPRTCRNGRFSVSCPYWDQQVPCFQ
jgi:hypothetical protein